MSAKLGSFEKDGKEYATIELLDDQQGKRRLTFGLSKAKLILDHVDQIKQFVAANAKSY